MHILTIAAAVFAVEVLLGIVTGRFLHRCSQLADLTDLEVMPLPPEGPEIPDTQWKRYSARQLR